MCSSYPVLSRRLSAADALVAPYLHAGPVPRPANWLEHVHQPLTEAELERVRRSVNRGTPYGSAAWAERTARRLGLEASLRPRGRPRKAEK